ncbi:MAG: insulinase family protein [Selenomonadaceae bacterium]|nr:insulinase family protein [Selenomonadaceae bacterium]
MELKINDELHGFKVKKVSDVAEISSKVYELEHLKTCAKVLYIANTDDNKTFFIAFRTPPNDDTGVAHICEHSVLNGSRKYPLKEPFVELVKGSMNTFLNALTYSDKTVYPVSSRNDKDFRNLVDVYIDGVLYPAMLNTPEILMQEGWHYEIENADSPLTYSGVVYSEMKGALSAPEDILGRKSMHELFPDNCYGFESGGDPEAIPNLTYEDFVNFHKKFYHPSNSYIYIYGDVDIEEQLKYLDSEYLSKFEKIEIESEIVPQKPFAEMKRVTDFYPVGEEENDAEKTFLSLNLVMGDIKDSTTILGLEILNHALFQTPAAPLKKAIIDSKLGKDIDAGMDEDLLQPAYSLTLSGSEADRADKFLELVNSEMKKLVAQGIDKTLLQASINLFEFRLREADFGFMPKGLIYGLRSLRTWIYDGDPTTYLRYEDDLKIIKDGLNNGYFEKLLQKYFIDNPHKVLMTLAPSKTVAKERDAATAAKLAEIKSKMTPAEIQNVIDIAKNLKIRQQTPDSPEALEKIPIIKISDIKKEPEKLPLMYRDIDGTRILFSNVDTHGIIYLTFYFDALKVPQSKVFYAFLLNELIGRVDTRQHSYEDLANLVNLNIGGFGTIINADSKKNEPKSFLPRLKVFAKCLSSKVENMSEILSEIFTQSIFTNKKRLREIIEEEQIGIELNLQNSATAVVSARIASYFSTAGAYNDSAILPFNEFLKDLLKNFDEKFDELVDELEDVYNRLLNRNGLIISVTATDELYKNFLPSLKKILKSLPVDEYPRADYGYPCVAQNEGLYSQSRVQYVGKGANFINLGYEYSGALSVLETILRYEYFWIKIRVQGGAYGAFVNFTRNGGMFFGSYRDPNLKNTLDTFDSTAEFLRNFDVSDREMDKYIIGTMSKVDKPLTPSIKGQIAAECCLKGITYEDRQKARTEILNARQEDIRKLAELVEACMKENNLCVFGNENVIKDNAALFKNIKPAV